MAPKKKPKATGPKEKPVAFSTTGTELPEELFPKSTTIYKVKFTFTEPVLGPVPKNPKLYEEYIASKAPPEVDTSDEMATLPKEATPELQAEAEKKGWTGFHTEKGKDGQPDRYFFFDYVIRGFFKESCGALKNVPKSASKLLTSYKKKIDKLAFVRPRRLYFTPPAGQAQFLDKDGLPGLDRLERPLRAMTQQGERIALVRSDIIPAGALLEFVVAILGDITFSQVKEWLRYAVLSGLGQWRSGGYGTCRVDVEILAIGEEEEEEPPKAE